MVKKTKPQVKARNQPARQPDKVPPRYVFWCHDGSIFADINELAEGLESMSDDTFAYHSNVEKRDFSKWVREVVQDEPLACDLEKANGRLQAAEYVAARIAALSNK